MEYIPEHLIDFPKIEILVGLGIFPNPLLLYRINRYDWTRKSGGEMDYNGGMFPPLDRNTDSSSTRLFEV